MAKSPEAARNESIASEISEKQAKAGRLPNVPVTPIQSVEGAIVMDVAAFLEAFTGWASKQPDIEAVALVGSYARGAATPESDVDLIILTKQVAKYFRGRSWVRLFGHAEECRVENWGRAKSLRVSYRDGPEIEYGFAMPDWASLPLNSGTREVVSDGLLVLLDPKGALKELQRTANPG